MKYANIVFDKSFQIGNIDPRLASSFIEHHDRCLYGGIYEPTHPNTDQRGFRKDVKEMLKELSVQSIRYPGGNFVSGYNWKDGIGPKENRPTKMDLAWCKLETNQVGTDEFAACMEDIGVEVMMAVNLGSGTPMEASELVEYCNIEKGTYWSDLRRKYGRENPYKFKLWCLGNEMDNRFQICGAATPYEYARKYLEAAKVVKCTDPSIELVACGSFSNDKEINPLTLGEWEWTLLEHAYEYIDYISIHRYYRYLVEDLALKVDDSIGNYRDIAFIIANMEEFIKMVSGAINLVKGMKHSKHNVYVSIDEWSVDHICQKKLTNRFGIGEHYTEFSSLDAVIYGALFCTFINYADSVKITCQSMLINDNGMISTKPGGEAIYQPTFYPFMHIAKYATGIALRPGGKVPEIDTPHYGMLPGLITAAAFDEKLMSVNVFFANIDTDEDIEVSLDLSSFCSLSAIGRTELYQDNPFELTTFENPNCNKPHELEPVHLKNGKATFTLRKHSWNVLRYHII